MPVLLCARSIVSDDKTKQDSEAARGCSHAATPAVRCTTSAAFHIRWRRAVAPLDERIQRGLRHGYVQVAACAMALRG
jgi:hypothetical protein